MRPGRRGRGLSTTPRLDPDQELGEPNLIVEEQRARAAKEGAGADPLAALQQIGAN